MMKSYAVLICLVLLCCEITAQPYGHFAGIAGSYCRTQIGNRCCDGRVDECSFPILGTRCYCDQFCNRTINPDCCPDYWSTCLGMYEALEGPGTLVQYSPCHINGKKIAHNAEDKDNCNVCKCDHGELKCSKDRCLVDNKLLNHVTEASHAAGWSARNYSRFWGKKMQEGLFMLTGTLAPLQSSLRIYPIDLHYNPKMIPNRFDARTQWPWAQIGQIWDQGWCGASWAFSTASVAEDRLAIESGGKEVVNFSRQNLLSCNRKGQQACKGGHVDRAWNYLRKYGVVAEECFPYISGEKGITGDCKVPKKGGLLSTVCPSTAKIPMGRKEFYRTEPPYRIASNEEDIMWEIMTTGPVQAIMKVHPDFLFYESGIYSREGLGYDENFSHHSVKILGWGEEASSRARNRAPQKYWLCMNSWGESWGERGLFRIRRGVNETEIEHFIVTARARLGDKHYSRGHPALTRRRRHHRHRRV